MAAPYRSPVDVPSYAPHGISQSFDPNIPPAPPPKPGSQEVSRQGTPAAGQALPPPPPDAERSYMQDSESHPHQEDRRIRDEARAQKIQDPSDRWLPKILEDKSKQDLSELLSKSELLSALSHSRSTAHPSSAAAEETLQIALNENISLALHLNELEARLVHLRGSTQTQLLATHSLERQWRQKQSEMDRALSPFSPSSLYQRLSQGVQEQEMVCRALEESFLEGDGAVATEREIIEWVRRYREAKKLYYSRRERKERWDEGRVGGWR